LGEAKDLSELKICFGHFGGDAEWDLYREDAWNKYNNHIAPDSFADYQNNPYKNTLNHGSKRTIWWNASWLSIIYDLMIKYQNVYADISFILYREDLFPLLKYLLIDPKVKDKILFGSDFYVVSHKGLDKELYQNLRSSIGDDLFEQIAIKNPSNFLT
jgi:predicted TIM-barrel fold metal-dependent hydrolase